MKIQPQKFTIKNLQYIIRHAVLTDAKQLSSLRVLIDGETENLDREAGEAFIDPKGFEQIIICDTETINNLFLVAKVENRIVGFARCEGSQLKRLSHKVEFGVCVLKEFWGYGIGKNLLKQAISWADANHIHKINLSVLETNEKAIKLYEKLGFEVEGVLKKDKVLSNGRYYNTILMGRFKE
ncbi:GNAT family N-acetyltransferase [Gottfriedia acidiceleris]|uniref:GNAT family N-acetyltransferase n=1 Tax=Gottfriedia acidiceleris TaxID=371036 RepID=UPI000B437B8E|nr:GNAT family N-acetyltransferase [Gottfriedia acidiceleris]